MNETTTTTTTTTTAIAVVEHAVALAAFEDASSRLTGLEIDEGVYAVVEPAVAETLLGMCDHRECTACAMPTLAVPVIGNVRTTCLGDAYCTECVRSALLACCAECAWSG